MSNQLRSGYKKEKRKVKYKVQNSPHFPTQNLFYSVLEFSDAKLYEIISPLYLTILNLCTGVQLCPTLCDPMDCSQPASSVHGILQARILECVAISYSKPSNLYLSRLLHWQADIIQLIFNILHLCHKCLLQLV